jgi:hypothetical protein
MNLVSLQSESSSMVRRSRSIPLPQPASLTNFPPASLSEALRVGLKICERCRLERLKQLVDFDALVSCDTLQNQHQ